MQIRLQDPGQPPEDTKGFERTAVRVSMVSILGNAVLSLVKLLAGVIAHSGAMVSDAVHSASDVFSSIIVIIGVKISAREADKEHPYGHERFECVAAIILSVVLLVTGLLIGRSAFVQIISGDFSGTEAPGVLALAAAIVSIVSKEAMYWYTRYYAKKMDSSSLMANAWHHRSDALSSVGALIGILFARMGYRIVEPIASLVICLLILKATYDIFRDAISRMVDSGDEGLEDELRELALSQEQIRGVDLVRARVFGNRIYVDMEISADGDMTLRDSHAAAERLHDLIEEKYPKVKHIMLHVNPAEDGVKRQ
jgi:cation diffusion facilitator family transporter